MSATKFLLLKADLDRELRQLGEVAAECERELCRVGDRGTPAGLELRGLGSLLHDFYTGVERIFVRVANELDGELPHGEEWHMELMRRMADDLEGVRPAVIAQETVKLLRPYLRFRHLFRNIYGSELVWERLHDLLAGLAPTWSGVRNDMAGFEAALKSLARDCAD